MKPFREDTPRLNGAKTWLYCINQQIDVSRISKLAPVDMHYHEYVELLYSLESRAHIWIGDQRYSFTDGDLAIIHSDEPHDLTFEGDSRILCVKFSPQFLYADEDSAIGFQYAFPLLAKERQKHFFSSIELEKTQIRACAMEIWQEWAAKETGYELIVRADLLRIFARIFRSFPAATSEFCINEKMQKALLYLSENFSTATEAEAARICGLSYHHFSAAFKKATSRSFKDYLLDLRLHNAKCKLLTTNATVTQIAFDTGFVSSSHFISLFRKHTGQTPKQFRDACTRRFPDQSRDRK